MKIRTVIPAFFAACVTATSAAFAQRVLKVPSQYKTIQAAIDAANNSDTVLVAPGLYQESIDFKGKPIHVRSSHGASMTTIQEPPGPWAGTVVKFVKGESRKSILEGFTITGGNNLQAGGISCGGSSPTIRFNVITGNEGNDAGPPHAGKFYWIAGCMSGTVTRGIRLSPTITLLLYPTPPRAARAGVLGSVCRPGRPSSLAGN